MTVRRTQINDSRLDAIVAGAQRDRVQRERGYREQALKLYPWVCGRCSRSFERANLHELTVHHRNHDHDDNPADGSNWELLCLYCHDNEHQRRLDHDAGARGDDPGAGAAATSQPFAALRDLLGKR